MATLIGREAWHVGGCLSHGIVTKHSDDMTAVTIHEGVAFGDITVHSSQVLLTLKSAIEHAEDMADYWARQTENLRNELTKRELLDGSYWKT